jgi:hypothetical protein
MAEKLDGKELVTFDELTLSNAWELEASSKCCGEGRHHEARSARQVGRASPPESSRCCTADGMSASPHKMDVLVSHILEIFNSTGFIAQQAKCVDGRPYKRKDELVQKEVIPQATYDSIKDAVADDVALLGKRTTTQLLQISKESLKYLAYTLNENGRAMELRLSVRCGRVFMETWVFDWIAGLLRSQSSCS